MKKVAFVSAITVACLLLFSSLGRAQSTVSQPQFGSQYYGGLVIISIVSPTAGSTIRYTTNGSDPTEASQAYSPTTQVALTTSATVKARAFKRGMTPSPVTTANYTVYNVSQIVFEPEHSPLDNNPNPGGGLRIFPEQLSPFETVFRDTVLVTVTITPAAPHVVVYFRLFDPDDPSSNVVTIDPNGGAGTDNFSDFTGRSPQGALNSAGASTDRFGKASVRLTVSWQPGNNFIVSAATDPFYAERLRLRSTDSTLVEDQNGIALTDSRARARRTPLLTVWRRLHIEVDRMANVAGNSINGVIAGVEVDTRHRLSTIDLGLNLPAPGISGTDGLLNRFEGGTISINGVGTYPVVSNTAAVKGNDRVVVSGLVPQPALGRPYVLVDDDVSHGFGDGATIPFPNTGRLVSCFASAYIVPVFDLANPTPIVPLVLNTPGTTSGDLMSLYRFDNKQSAKRQTYWVVYLLSAMQGRVTEDGDPDRGLTVGEVDAIGGLGAIIYQEALVEANGGRHLLTNSIGTGEQDVVVQQIGHLFGAERSDGGLMSQLSNVFSPQSLKKIRQALYP